MTNGNSGDQILARLAELVESNLNNEQFGVEELADAIGLSRSQLHRKLKQTTGQSISQFIREYRLKKAHELLLSHNLTAAEAAYQVGFSSATYFSKTFHDYFGFTPGEARQKKEPSKTTGHKYKLFGAMAIIAALVIFYLFYQRDHAEEQEKSIVVIPFVNMSNNPDQQHFADGIMEAVLNNLTQMDEVRVISRTTSMRYKNTDKSIPEIAEELNVNYVLEGGVQENEGQIRVNAQLIEAATDNHLWSEQYDREFKNIFEIQTDIASSIARALNAHISREEKNSIQQPITRDPLAYEQYLRGKYLVQGSWALDNIKESRKYFKEAIKRDSSFVEAYIWMGSTYLSQGTWYGDMSNEEATSLANPYFEKARAIDPDHPDLLWNLAVSGYFFEWDFERTEKNFKKGDNLHFDLMIRRFGTVIEESLNRIQIDPFISTIYWNLAYAYYHTGQKEKALEAIDRGFQADPEQEAYYDHFGNLYNAMGMYKEAEKVLKKGLSISSKRHASMIAHLAITYDQLNQHGKRDELMEELRQRAAADEAMINVFIAHAYAGLNEPDSAFYYLNRSYVKHEVDMIWLQADPNLLLLKEDPRYTELLAKVGFPEETWPVE